MVRLTGSCANWPRLRLVAMRCTCASIRPSMSVLPWQLITCACGAVIKRSEISRILSPSTRTCMSSRTSGDVPSQRVQCVRTMRLIGVSPDKCLPRRIAIYVHSGVKARGMTPSTAGEDILHTRCGTDRITPVLHHWQTPRGNSGKLSSSGRLHGTDPCGKPDENLSRGEAPCRPVGGCDRSRTSYVLRHSGTGGH